MSVVGIGRWVADRESLPLRTRVACTFAAVALLHLAAVACLAGGIAQGRSPIAFGVVLAAYLAGLKHSYDWDHIAAIDNSTRKFVDEGRRPAGVGFAFSLGHSSVVTLATALVLLGSRAVHGAFADGSRANTVLGLVGSGVSGGYLLVLGLFNAAQARRLARHAAGSAHSHDLDGSWGLVSRLIRRPLERVCRPRDIFVIGFLFGLGFDTATTIGLMVLTVSASMAGVAPLALLGLPLAFTSAMTLCDSLNGLAMMHLYSAALADRGRRHRFNLTVTLVSAVSALLIAALTLAGVLRTVLHLDDPVTGWLAGVELGHAGLALVGLMLLLWLGFRLLGSRSATVLPGDAGEVTSSGHD